MTSPCLAGKTKAGKIPKSNSNTWIIWLFQSLSWVKMADIKVDRFLEENVLLRLEVDVL